jgi:hypothetical protein
MWLAFVVTDCSTIFESMNDVDNAMRSGVRLLENPSYSETVAV